MSVLDVLVVTHTTSFWGAERVVTDLAMRLGHLGIGMTLASPGEGPFTQRWRAAGFDVAPYDVEPRAGLRGDGGARAGVNQLREEAARSGRAALRLRRLARDFDVIHSNSLNAHVESVWAGRLARRPALVHLHDIVRPGMGRALLASAVAASSRTVAAAGAVAQSLPSLATRRRVTVIEPGVDVDRFTPGPTDPALRRMLADEPGAPLVGIVGRLDEVKGIDVLIEAMAALPGDVADAQLVVVGSGLITASAYGERLQRDAERLVGRRVRFVGPRDDVPSVLRCLDVLVNASRVEPFGMTVLEAQACGVPTIATTSGGVGERVIDGQNGLLVPPDDPPALTNALVRLLRDPDLARDIAAGGRRLALTRYGVERKAEAFAQVYRELVA